MADGDPRINQILQELSNLEKSPTPVRSNPKVDILQDMVSGVGSIFSGSDVPLEILARSRRQALAQEELDLERTRQKAFILREQLGGILDTQRTQADVTESAERVADMRDARAYAPRRRQLEEGEIEAKTAESRARTTESTTRTRIAEQEAQYLPDREKRSADEHQLKMLRDRAEFDNWLEKSVLDLTEQEQRIELNKRNLESAKRIDDKATLELEGLRLDQELNTKRAEVVRKLLDSGDHREAFALWDHQITDIMRNANRNPENLTDVLKSVAESDPMIVEKSFDVAKDDDRQTWTMKNAMNRYTILEGLKSGNLSPEAAAVGMLIQDVEMDLDIKGKNADGQSKFFTTRVDPITGDATTVIETSKQRWYLDQLRQGITPELVTALKQSGEWEDIVMEIHEKVPDMDIRHVSRYLQGVDDRNVKTELSPEKRKKIYQRSDLFGAARP